MGDGMRIKKVSACLPYQKKITKYNDIVGKLKKSFRGGMSEDKEEFVQQMMDEGTNAELEEYEMHPAYKDITLEQIKGLANCVMEMVTLKEKDPKLFAILVYKMMNPGASLNDIAMEFDIGSKQLVSYYLKKAVKLFPECSNAIINNVEYNKWR